MNWNKIEDYLFEKYCVEGEDKELCNLMEEHNKEIREEAIEEFAKKLKQKSGWLETYTRAFGNTARNLCELIDEIAEHMKGE